MPYIEVGSSLCPVHSSSTGLMPSHTYNRDSDSNVIIASTQVVNLSPTASTYLSIYLPTYLPTYLLLHIDSAAERRVLQVDLRYGDEHMYQMMLPIYGRQSNYHCTHHL
jgi:hypothetical protein